MLVLTTKRVNKFALQSQLYIACIASITPRFAPPANLLPTYDDFSRDQLCDGITSASIITV